MKALILITLVFGMPALAETIATGLALDFEEVPATQSTGSMVQKAVTTDNAPSATLVSDGKFDSPVKVYVDKSRQLMTVYSPESPDGETFKVSTGGGLKIPNFEDETKNVPYCAETPDVEGRIMRAKPGVTMKPLHESSEFRDAQGRKAPMKNAILIDGARGIYFHEVLPNYQGYMGDNRSGGCVRLFPKDSRRLYYLMEKYGSLEINIYGQRRQPPEASGPRGWTREELRRGCTPEMAQAMHQQMLNGENVERTGDEGIFTGIFDALGSLFGGGGGKPRKSPSYSTNDDSQATVAIPAPSRRQRDESPGSLMQQQLGGGF